MRGGMLAGAVARVSAAIGWPRPRPIGYVERGLPLSLDVRCKSDRAALMRLDNPLRVMVDGKEVRRVVAYDVRAGWVEAHCISASGGVVVDRSRGEAVTCRQSGVVDVLRGKRGTRTPPAGAGRVLVPTFNLAQASIGEGLSGAKGQGGS